MVADFVAEAIYAGVEGDEPTQARVLLSEDQLVLAGDGGRTSIDLDDVFDVVVSKIPDDLGSFLDQSVLVAYAADGERRTAVIRGDHERIDRFSLFLHKAILRSEPAELRHPIREGGRVRDPAPQTVAVLPGEDAVRFRSQETDLNVALDDVVEIDYRQGNGGDRPTLVVRHRDGDDVVTSEIVQDDANRLNVLTRHLRSEYYRADEVLQELDLERVEQRALVALYAGVAPDALGAVLDTDDGDDGRSGGLGESSRQPVDPESVLAGLVDRELVTDDGTLTHDGALVAIHRIDEVED
ncbi:hypothetical protein L593_02345 [Salinarchaeum sp. Harcht-Bsk1]|uniref:CheF family chemotaxis protein n=1 Tax=Salinarchaeum sp. Harcht-Bsk1 TaxID=1333523 RepID=UPI0003422AFA|nr:CheF family chemotaxis protein [Salinarchaeum sp. Harcht-Bsk1]AGN00420.1 hypothetical protein L593_02345 [Salinarchaeum sp. Harcht-Bsk1]